MQGNVLISRFTTWFTNRNAAFSGCLSAPAPWFSQISFLIALILITPQCLSNETTVRYLLRDKSKTTNDRYYSQLLSLALEKTKQPNEKIILKPVDIGMLQRRALEALLNANTIDIVWTMTSIEREKTFVPIRIPLKKGLMGYRVLLINKKDRAKFDSIKSLSQLKKLTGGQGRDWPDTKILQANKFKLITSMGYNELFKMLQANRFDFFPRSVSEAWAEVAGRPNSGLMVQPSIMLKYTSPFYFFVNPKQKKLAARIEKGLRLAIKDGSFDKLFQEHLRKTNTIPLAELKKMKVYELSNPYLSKETPIDEEALWYQQ